MSTEEPAKFDPNDPMGELEKAIQAMKENNLQGLVVIAEAFVNDLPESPYGYALLGVASALSNETGQAIAMMTKAHAIDPDAREIAEALAFLNFSSGNMTDGVYFAKVSETLEGNQGLIDVIPYSIRDYPSAFDNMQLSKHYIEGMRAYAARQYGSCINECMRELRHNPKHKEASELLGYALLKTGRLGRAVSAFQSAVYLDPTRARALAGLGEATLNLGRTDEAKACFLRAQTMAPEDPVVLAQSQQGLARAGGDKAALKGMSDDWYARVMELLPSRKKRSDGANGDKIRVGIVSDMFYTSYTEPYFSPILMARDKSKIEIALYSSSQVKDGKTSRLRVVADSWRDIEDIDQFTLAETLAREELDVIIDLCFEPDDQAIEFFAVGAARNQVSWLPPFEAASFLGMTHVFSDEMTLPVDKFYANAEQKCLTPINGILSREPYIEFDELIPSPVAENKMVMFGMRADSGAVRPEDAFMISDLLRAVPGSRLLLGLSERIDKDVQHRLVELFSMGGVVDRIVFQELPDGNDIEQIWQDVVQSFFQEVDIFLSPSGATKFDDIALSLWMGAPAVAMLGQTRWERLSASALKQAGWGNWVASTPEDFVGVAKEMAHDVTGLIEMRKTLRENVQTTNLFNTGAVASEIWNSVTRICEC